MYDIFFISYDEPNADTNWKILKDRFIFSTRIDKVDGILNAHILAAKKSFTKMFYVVDGDAEILDSFFFDYKVHPSDQNFTHIYRSINPVNKLEYGYGAVKLFPKKIFQPPLPEITDMTTQLSLGIKVIDSASNITKFNTDPFNTWKSAFRECVKLSSTIIPNQNHDETNNRLQTWCTVGIDQPFGEYAIAGAKEGKEFGMKYKNDLNMLRKINDWNWLRDVFGSYR
jgi:hypothetical protein